jgi:hypothetical protein
MKADHRRRAPASSISIASSLLIASLVAACSHHPPVDEPAPVAAPRPNGISLRDGWHATVLVQRDDSIILTLPSGDRQLQRFERNARFTMMMDGDGRVSLRLDSLTFRPRTGNGQGTAPVGATWAGRAGDAHVNAMHVTGGGDPAAELTAVVRNLLPRLPVGGVHARMIWADSSTGDVRVDIFKASEHRTAAWSSGALSQRAGAGVLPVLLREDFEQLGDGQQGGRKITMTSQGRRIGTYYLTTDGRVSGAQLDDSVAMLISIPDTKQVVPTMRYARTIVRFIPAPHDESE